MADMTNGSLLGRIMVVRADHKADPASRHRPAEDGDLRRQQRHDGIAGLRRANPPARARGRRTMKTAPILVVAVALAAAACGSTTTSAPSTTTSTTVAPTTTVPYTPPPAPGATLANYDRIHNGMTLEQVVAILGPAPEPYPVTGLAEVGRNWHSTELVANQLSTTVYAVFFSTTTGLVVSKSKD